MSLPPPTCPDCDAELTLKSVGDLDFWACPLGHGLGFTMTEAYGRIEDDEISALWHGSETAPAGKRTCPMCGVAMVEVTIGVDADEAAFGAAGDTSDTATATIDVCRDDELFWFDAGELDRLPADLPAPPPSDDEQRKAKLVLDTFDADLDAAEAARPRGPLDRMADAVVQRHPGFVRVLDRAVYRSRLDAA